MQGDTAPLTGVGTGARQLDRRHGRCAMESREETQCREAGRGTAATTVQVEGPYAVTEGSEVGAPGRHNPARAVRSSLAFSSGK